MHSKRKQMNTVQEHDRNTPLSHRADLQSDLESSNKYKTLFKKQADEDEEDEFNNQSGDKGMFDLSALHKRNERHR